MTLRAPRSRLDKCGQVASRANHDATDQTASHGHAARRCASHGRVRPAMTGCWAGACGSARGSAWRGRVTSRPGHARPRSGRAGRCSFPARMKPLYLAVVQCKSALTRAGLRCADVERRGEEASKSCRVFEVACAAPIARSLSCRPCWERWRSPRSWSRAARHRRRMKRQIFRHRVRWGAPAAHPLRLRRSLQRLGPRQRPRRPARTRLRRATARRSPRALRARPMPVATPRPRRPRPLHLRRTWVRRRR